MAVSRSDIRAAIFDLGGVMTLPVFRHHRHVDADLVDLVAFFLDDFRDVYHLTEGAHDLHLLETGTIDDDEFFRRLTERFAAAGNPRIDPARAMRAVWGQGLEACAAMVDAVRQVKGSGYATALLTNVSRSGEEMRRELIPVDELFDVVIDSSQVGLRKPDPRIYQLTCQRLRVDAEHCLFIDDLECNVEAAATLGMTTIHCRDPIAVADEVVELLLGHPASAELAAPGE